MTLSPDDLEKKVENAVKTHFDNIVTNIDGFLEVSRMILGFNVSYAYKVKKCGDTPEIREAVLGRVIKAYEAAGWNVSYDAARSELKFKMRK